MSTASTDIQTTWQSLSEEIEKWRMAGREVALWWRDDDVIEPTPELARLTGISRQYDIPLSLAVIPANMSETLVKNTDLFAADTCLLVHGLDHQNRAPADKKKAEFASQRPLADMAADLVRALDLLKRAFPDHALPVLVPPWNRIPDAVIPVLTEIGFVGLSTYKDRDPNSLHAGLHINNCHVDPINWKSDKAFLGEVATLQLLRDHLRAKRRKSASLSTDQGEITGILTHHLVQDAKTWAFLEKFAAWTAEQPSVRWLDAREAFKLS
jgi:hypothetical protein